MSCPEMNDGGGGGPSNLLSLGRELHHDQGPGEPIILLGPGDTPAHASQSHLSLSHFIGYFRLQTQLEFKNIIPIAVDWNMKSDY